MPQKHLEAFREFHRLYPFDDYHRLYRPAALIATALGGGSVQDRLDWLEPPANESGWSQAELNSFKAHGITPPFRE